MKIPDFVASQRIGDEFVILNIKNGFMHPQRSVPIVT